MDEQGCCGSSGESSGELHAVAPSCVQRTLRQRIRVALQNPVGPEGSAQRWMLYLVVIVAALGGLLYGYDTAVISGAMLFLRAHFMLSPLMQEITVSSSLLGAAIGALGGGRLSDVLGRRRTLLVTASAFTIGTLCTALATHWMTFLGLRLFVGCCIGAIASVVPVYISEVSPSRLRGRLVTAYQLALSIGIALAYWVDLAFTNMHLGWPPMYAVSAIPGTILLFGVLFIPESPRWLASKGHWTETAYVLERLHGTRAIQEWREVRTALRQRRGSWRALFQSGLRMALVVAVGLALLQQFVGINTVIYYAPTIFEYTGFTSATSAIMAAGIIGIVNVLSTIVAGILIDRVGRRTLLLYGTASMAVALAALGAVFMFDSSSISFLALLVLLLYVVAFAMSLGPVFWLLSAELFPTQLRSVGASIATCVNWSANLLVSVTFLSLISLVGKSYTFWLYACMAVLAFVFCWFLVPETRNRSLEQIERYWRNHGHWDSLPHGLTKPGKSGDIHWI
jgi:MFS transporter, sugar porter (SP) family